MLVGLRRWSPRSRSVDGIAYLPISVVDVFLAQKAIASKGGKSSGGQFEAGSERTRQAGRKGGAARGGGGESEE
jgi:hypothetical protein